MKKIIAAVLMSMMMMIFFASTAEEFDFSFPSGVAGDILTQISVTPSVVKTPQAVDVCIAIKNSTRDPREVTLYSPAAQQIGEPHQLEPDQIVFVNCRYDVNQRTVENGVLTYFIQYSMPNEYGKEIEQSQSIRYKLNDGALYLNEPTQTPKPTSEWPSLTAKEVMYNYANSYQKDFYLKGVGELTNYYNYAYDDYEKTHFCMRVSPSDSYYDSWYIYFHRASFQELFDYAVQNSKVSLEMKCNVTRYTDGQRDMAEALRVRWGK
ncbi:MAG: hypothetical protein PUD16_02630 [bacterium]|nr:hypothetical protein [bacterium]